MRVRRELFRTTPLTKDAFAKVFNFWEPMHYLDRGYGFQTWEVSPQYAIRSWAYIVLHWWPVSGVVRLLSVDKACRNFYTNFGRLTLLLICCVVVHVLV